MADYFLLKDIKDKLSLLSYFYHYTEYTYIFSSIKFLPSLKLQLI